jgi:hypothetical protein
MSPMYPLTGHEINGGSCLLIILVLAVIAATAAFLHALPM